jgi:hypothetical protein
VIFAPADEARMLARVLSISIFTQRIALRIRTYSLDQRICFQIIEENTGFLRLVSGWVVGNRSVTRPNGQRRVRCGLSVTRPRSVAALQNPISAMARQVRMLHRTGLIRPRNPRLRKV